MTQLKQSGVTEMLTTEQELKAVEKGAMLVSGGRALPKGSWCVEGVVGGGVAEQRGISQSGLAPRCTWNDREGPQEISASLRGASNHACIIVVREDEEVNRACSFFMPPCGQKGCRKTPKHASSDTVPGVSTPPVPGRAHWRTMSSPARSWLEPQRAW
jgi:hypothetical protein